MMSSRQTDKSGSISVTVHPPFTGRKGTLDLTVPCDQDGVAVGNLLRTLRSHGILDVPELRGRTDESAWSHAIVLAQGRVLKLGDIVKPGDHVSVLPPMSGG